ncbi:FecR family protein [Echinimonas agarilytica]|uniref:FecR domain-containing protein n=1 Tax=Echinimonas agarilytica TaxID=1215918 RepID=A0AA41W8A3_9GAMM|nr:FecR domain-containing protein [Echinimonas agarilytica]MCM2680342.1 FecR domain-containing protein [Echinimonas agarilytica]
MSQFTPQFSEDVLEEAADWLDQIHELTAQEQAELMIWLSEPSHYSALMYMSRALGIAEINTVLAGYKDNPIDIPLHRVTNELDLSSGEASSAPKKKSAARHWLIAASVCAFVVTASVLLSQQSQLENEVIASVSVPLHTLSAPIGKNEQVELDDGTKLHMNSHSTLHVSLTKDIRQTQLDYGEVYFDVARDTSRPFVIQTSFADIEVLGTRFNVDAQGDGLTVTVDEGHVRVREQYDLYPGDRLFIDLLGQVEVTQFDAKNRADWRSGWLDITDVELEKVIQQLQHYSPKKLVVEPSLGQQMMLSGRFNIRTPSATLALIGELHQVDIVETPANIYLSRIR